MGIWDKLLRAEQNIRKRVENVFRHGGAQTPLEIRREILEQVESRIVVDSGRRFFPFGKVTVRFQPSTEALRAVFAAAFIQGGSLEMDIRQSLKNSKVLLPGDLEIIVDNHYAPPLGITDLSNRSLLRRALSFSVASNSISPFGFKTTPNQFLACSTV